MNASAAAAEHVAGQRLETQRMEGDRYFATRPVVVHPRHQQMHHARLLVRRHHFPGRVQPSQRSPCLGLVQTLLLHRLPLRPQARDPLLDLSNPILQRGQA